MGMSWTFVAAACCANLIDMAGLLIRYCSACIFFGAAKQKIPVTDEVKGIQECSVFVFL